MEMIKSQSHKLTDEKKGTFLPFRKIWEAEGLDAAGLSAALI